MQSRWQRAVQERFDKIRMNITSATNGDGIAELLCHSLDSTRELASSRPFAFLGRRLVEYPRCEHGSGPGPKILGAVIRPRCRLYVRIHRLRADRPASAVFIDVLE